MKRERRLGEFEQMVLYAVLDLSDVAYGAAVVRAIETRTGDRPSVGAVGSALDRLHRRGLLSSRMGEPESRRGGRRPRLYRLEPAGAQALRRSRQALSRMSSGLAARLDEAAAATQDTREGSR